MTETIQLGEIAVAVTCKEIKHVHLSVHPPDGRVTLVVPKGTRPEAVRAYAISRLGWIREKQSQMRGQARKRPASSLSVKATPSGEGVICSLSGRKTRDPRSHSVTAGSCSPCVPTVAGRSARRSCTSGTHHSCTMQYPD